MCVCVCIDCEEVVGMQWYQRIDTEEKILYFNEPGVSSFMVIMWDVISCNCDIISIMENFKYVNIIVT